MTPRRQDSRFFQLLDQAKSGDEEAPHDLWINYRFDLTRDGDPRDQIPTRPMSAKQTNTKEK